MKHRTWLLTAGLLAAALLLASCADDAADTTTGPAATFATMPATSPATATSLVPATGPVPTAAPDSTGDSTEPLGDPLVQLVALASVDQPVDLAWRPGDSTLFVAGQNGVVVPVRDGRPGPPVLDMTSLTAAGGERGLLGLAFHPTEPLAYVDYTDRSGNTVIDEYRVGADGTFDPTSRRQVLTVDQPYSNHNGGEVVFGPDGYLYIGLGDGGSGGDPERRALNVSVLLGKILRIDPTAANGKPYTVPADNPFVSVAGAKPEVWLVGVRNPWRFGFDRDTGDLWIADVGQNQWEEVDALWADQGGGRGMNLGWSAWEATHRYNDDQNPDGVVMPIHEYEHGAAGCSISGGMVYRGPAIPELAGWYVYSDYCSGQVRALQIADRAVTRELTLAQSSQVSAVTEGPDGELYVLSLDGTVSLLSSLRSTVP